MIIAVVSVIVAAAAIIFSVVSYRLTRQRELAWKRTEFLSDQAKYLEDDPSLVEAITILEDRHPIITVDKIFGDSVELDDGARAAYKQKFDKLLGFLWRLCYAYRTMKTLSSKEVEAFGWYYWRVSRFPSLVDYCQEYGFSDIIAVITELKFDQ